MGLKRELWKIKTAETCMVMALELCNEYLRLNPVPDSPLGYGLLSAICVTYSRPFQRNQQYGEISGRLAASYDKEKRLVHKLLLDARNNLFAHHHSKHARMRIDIKAKDDGEFIKYEFYHGISQDYLNSRRVPLINEMCSETLGRLGVLRDDVLEKLFGVQRHWPTGMFELNLDDDSMPTQ